MMLDGSAILEDETLGVIAPSGYHIALRIGFAFPQSETNAWPANWVKHYTQQRFVLRDPVMRWVYGNTGIIRWNEIDDPDPDRVLQQAATFGLRFGAAVSYRDPDIGSLRSFGVFARSDRSLSDDEMNQLFGHVRALHLRMAPPSNLTAAELEALAMVCEGLRQKEIAFHLGITEGAVKQRLRGARQKLNAQTAPQAAAKAQEFGLI